MDWAVAGREEHMGYGTQVEVSLRRGHGHTHGLRDMVQLAAQSSRFTSGIGSVVMELRKAVDGLGAPLCRAQWLRVGV